MTDVFSIGRRRGIFLAAATGYVLSQFYRSFLTVISEELARDLGVGPGAFGTLGAAWFLAFSLFQFPVGMALDRLGPRRTITGLMSFAVIGALLFAMATSQGTAIFAMALIGIGCSPILMGALYVFARTEDPKRFATLASVFLAFGLFGSLVAATPLVLLVEALGWRHALRVVAVVTLLSMLAIALVLRDPPHEESPAGGGLFSDLLALLRVPAMWPILAMSVVISGPIFTERSLWVGPFFGEVFGLAAVPRGHAVFAFAVAMMVSAVLAGPVATRLQSPKMVVLGANLLCGLAFLGLGLWPGLSLGGAMGLMLFAGVFGVTYAVLVAHSRLFMPNHVIGRGITFVNFVSIGGTGITQLTSGWAIERMKLAGLPAPEIFAHIHQAFGVVLLIAVAIYAFAPERPKI